MKEQETFTMTYSATQQEEVQKIRDKYMKKEESKMESLRKLDEAVTNKATTKALIIGILGALILGTGMSLFMTEFGNVLGSLKPILGIGVGILGMLLVAVAYPVYQKTLAKEKEKAASEILRLSEELLKNQ